MKFLFFFEPDAVWTLIPICASLWSLGGSGIRSLRRIGVPAAISLAALSFGFPWWVCLLQCLSLAAVTSLPYGDNVKAKLKGFYYPFLFLVGASFGLSLLPIAWFHGAWIIYLVGVIVNALSFGLTTILSQKTGLPWKWFEILTGFLIGLFAAVILL